MRTLIMLLALAALSGCLGPRPGTPAQSPADQAIGHWVGRPVTEAIAAWGPPRGESVEDGRHLYRWNATQYGRSYYPSNLDPKPLPYGKTPQELACQGVMEVDGDGIVRRAEWEGYECHYLP